MSFSNVKWSLPTRFQMLNNIFHSFITWNINDRLKLLKAGWQSWATFKLIISSISRLSLKLRYKLVIDHGDVLESSEPKFRFIYCFLIAKVWVLRQNLDMRWVYTLANPTNFQSNNSLTKLIHFSPKFLQFLKFQEEYYANGHAVMQELYRDLWGSGHCYTFRIRLTNISFPRESVSLQNMNLDEKNGHEETSSQVFFRHDPEWS